VDRQLIGGENTLPILSRRVLKGKPESKMIAAEDLTLKTKYHSTKILQTERESKYRMQTI
jgi:hypothetical protein